jgi:hypothetical protein
MQESKRTGEGKDGWNERRKKLRRNKEGTKEGRNEGGKKRRKEGRTDGGPKKNRRKE